MGLTFCSLHYTSVERVATAAMKLGKGSLLVKLDIKSAYRQLPFHSGGGRCAIMDIEADGSGLRRPLLG